MRSVSTVEDYLLELGDEGAVNLDGVITNDVRRQVVAAIDRHGLDKLRMLKELLPPSISYFEIRVVAQQSVTETPF